jgi:hypothetical protein
VVLGELDPLVAFVQRVASQRGEDAEVVVAISDFDLKAPSRRAKWSFDVARGARSREAKLEAPRGHRGESFAWPSSIDRSAWEDLAPTSDASTAELRQLRAGLRRRSSLARRDATELRRRAAFGRERWATKSS